MNKESFIRSIDYSIVFKIILIYQELDWNERVPGFYGISGKAETLAGGAEEAKESRPMESEHPVVEINIIQLTYQ
ncbi:hypothetical protein ACFVR2_15030 [Gottfriedia sp. NPDC057991]|uniref:hypothetical protein n=1 Tax=Gottfriedia sp. NPDC057991 TaxID=3346298 RepID=UPI0036DE35AC